VVETIEYFGADTITACRLGTAAAGPSAADAQRLVVRTPGRPGLGAGAPVHLAWQPAAQHLFDAATGLRCDDA
jgi:hypothetical protein